MASDREQSPENNKDSQSESENLGETSQSTDDYFENVNRRLKKKSRFSIGKSDKKESAPKKQDTPKNEHVEAPEAPVVVEPQKAEENKPETIEVVTENQPTAEAEKQPTMVEPEPQAVEMPKEAPAAEETVAEQPSVMEPEVQPAQEPEEVTESIPESVPEPVIMPQHEPIEEVKPKKKGLFGFSFSLRRKHKETTPTNIPSVQINESSSENVEIVSQPMTQTESPALDGQVNPDAQQIPAEIVSEPADSTVNIEETSQPETVEPQRVPFFDGIVHIGKYTKDDMSRFPKKAVLSIGEYPIHLMLKSRFASKPDGVLPLFIDKSSLDIIKWSPSHIDKDYIIGLDSELDTHFWFNILPSLTSDSAFLSRLQSKPIDRLREALIVASIWDGVGSALLPTIISQFNERKINSVALAFMPSKIQSLESQFNAFAAVGKCAILGSASIVLLDRESIENYIGVDRNGNLITGSAVINYLLDLMLSRDTLIEEFSELSKTYDSPLYTLMFGTGASLRVYGSIENILDTLLFKQFLSFDMSSATLLYVLARVPYSLKEKVTRAKIEMAVANWFKDKATLQSIHVSEPVYVEDTSDRIDIALFIGGFNTTKIFGNIEKKVNTIKNKAIKNGLLNEDEWKEIVKKLVD